MSSLSWFRFRLGVDIGDSAMAPEIKSQVPPAEGKQSRYAGVSLVSKAFTRPRPKMSLWNLLCRGK